MVHSLSATFSVFLYSTTKNVKNIKIIQKGYNFNDNKLLSHANHQLKLSNFKVGPLIVLTLQNSSLDPQGVRIIDQLPFNTMLIYNYKM